jgi:hypothetical protein
LHINSQQRDEQRKFAAGGFSANGGILEIWLDKVN